jgi:hypothetical protein
VVPHTGFLGTLEICGDALRQRGGLSIFVFFVLSALHMRFHLYKGSAVKRDFLKA